MRLRIKLSISINEPAGDTTYGPDTEAQIGHFETIGDVDTGLGFIAPGPKLDEAFE